MKKIEPVAFYFKTEYSCGLAWIKIGKSTNPLYTREALEAVAKAVKAQCIEDAAAWSMSFVQVDNAPHGIDDELRKYVDTATIINQLTGE